MALIVWQRSGWRARACHGALGDAGSVSIWAARRSPIFAMLAARTGAAGSANTTAASCQQPRSANTPTRSHERSPLKWFALGRDRPLFAFAGLWTPWRGVRGPKSAPVDAQHELFGFSHDRGERCCRPRSIPRRCRSSRLPRRRWISWLLADAPKALELQRPLPDDALRIVASGEKEDGPRGCKRFTEVESQCFRCDRFEGLRGQARLNRSLSASVLILQRMIA